MMDTVKGPDGLGIRRDVGHSTQVLIFELDGQDYAVDMLQVREIMGWQDVTPLPDTPNYVRGVIDLRGTIVPIVDLRERFGREPRGVGPRTVQIVLRIDRVGQPPRAVGIVVDEVRDVYELPPGALLPAPDLGSAIDTDAVTGFVKVRDKMLILLDVASLLDRGDRDRVEPHSDHDAAVERPRFHRAPGR